jgi:hypothetical protein
MSRLLIKGGFFLEPIQLNQNHNIYIFSLQFSILADAFEN